MNIRKILACMLAVILLTACGTKIESTAPTTEPATQMVNPISEVTADEMTQKTGVALGAPADAENVRYFVIDVQPAIAQVTFDFGGIDYTYRASMAQLDALALSGFYFGSPLEAEVSVSYNKGTILTEGKSAVLYWEDIVPGICYTLSCTNCEDPAVLKEIAEQIFVPAQGDSDADANMAGTFEDSNFNDVMLTEAEEGGYTAVVGIYRLSTFEGTGALNGDTVELTLEDPSGGTLYATFAPAEDGTYTLTITHSTWNLLETGTVFEGFRLTSAG